MQVVPAMIDMKKTDQEKAMDAFPTSVSCQSDYPYGLCISLCQDELEKLGLPELNVDDMVHMHCMAIVTSVSKNATSGSDPTCRIELQITHMSSEDETEEDNKAELSMGKITSKLYR